MISVTVTEASQVAEARRRATRVASDLGFDETAAGRVAIVVTELATNLVKYASRGEILVGSYEQGEETGVEMMALDRGDGLADAEAALSDGHSTGGTAGFGLGAVRRQSRTFDVSSSLGRGMAVLSRVAPGRVPARPLPPAIPEFGVVTVPLRGEVANGDAYCLRHHADGWTLIVADGLGHGQEAATASSEAVRLFRDHEDEHPTAIIAAVHGGLRPTRGGAVSVARYDAGRALLTFCGIGNVAGTLVDGAVSRGTVTLAGTAGHNARRLQAFDYPLAPDGLFVLCSDGIGSGWSLNDYPGLAGAHPALVAAVIYRDHARARDDATVVVVRARSPTEAFP